MKYDFGEIMQKKTGHHLNLGESEDLLAVEQVHISFEPNPLPINHHQHKESVSKDTNT